MTRYISTKEVAAMLRHDLKAMWPGVKFSVRMSTGTASAWIHVHTIDGPTDREVRAVTARFEGRSFDGMTDSYTDHGTQLIVLEGEELPEETRFSCDGINTQRSFSHAAYVHVQSMIDDGGFSEIRVLNEKGEPDYRTAIPSDIAFRGSYYDYVYSPAGLADRILHDIDLTPITAAPPRATRK